jgi:hypothetical protein
MNTKTCAKCNIEKPLSDFPNNKNGPLGKASRCRVCKSLDDKQYSKNNAHKISAHKKQKYENDKEKVLQKQKEYRENNKEKKALTDKQYRENNTEKIKERKRRWAEENAERLSKKSKIYRQENKDKISVAQKEYRTRNKRRLRKQMLQYRKKRYREDISYRIKLLISSQIRTALKRRKLKKEESWTKMLPYTLEELKEYLESKMEPWMSWDNHGIYDPNRKTWQIDHVIPQSLFDIKEYGDEQFKLCWALENLQPLEAIENMKKSNKLPEPHNNNNSTGPEPTVEVINNE